MSKIILLNSDKKLSVIKKSLRLFIQAMEKEKLTSHFVQNKTDYNRSNDFQAEALGLIEELG